jgi:hypothetical protein
MKTPKAKPRLITKHEGNIERGLAAAEEESS